MRRTVGFKWLRIEQQAFMGEKKCTHILKEYPIVAEFL
jgi:hypothetical protein